MQCLTSVEVSEYPNSCVFLSVLINNQTRTLQSYYGSAPPECQGLVNKNEGRVDLPPGVYSWKAKYLTDSVSRTITINRGTCVLQEVKF